MPIALAELAPEAVAALALLVVLCAWFITQLLVALLKAIHIDAIPIVGGAIIGAVQWVAQGIANDLGWLWQHANPISMFMATAGWMARTFAGFVSQLSYDAYSLGSRIVGGAIPRAISALQGALASDIAQAVSYAEQLYNQALAFATAAVATATAALSTAIAQAVSYAEQLYNQALAFALSHVAAAVSYFEQLYNQALAYADARVGQAIDQIDTSLGALRTAIDGELQGIRDWITSGVLPAIAAAMGAIAAVEADWGKWRNECGDPLCNNLGSFGSELNALENALSLGAILALLTGAVSDPGGTVSVVENVFVTPVEDAVSTIAALVGVRAA